MELKPIKYKREYETAIANKITVWLWTNIFQELFIILKSNKVYNADNAIRDAIEQGKIYFKMTHFIQLRVGFQTI